MQSLQGPQSLVRGPQPSVLPFRTGSIRPFIHHARPHHHHALVRPTAGARGVALQGEVLSTSEAIYVADPFQNDTLWEPSHDLRELAAAQLRSLFAVLSRVSPSHSSSCRACVYARRADSIDTAQIKLQRVACWPSIIHNPGLWAASADDDSQQLGGSSGSYNSFEELDDLLILHRPAWEPGSSSSSSDRGAWDTEASLCQEEVVLLPSSNMLVLPLAEGGGLVGLLVVEVSGGSSSDSSPEQQHWGAAGLSEDALWCLRMAVPPLAKACAMDLRQALAGAQQEAQQQLARSLLNEARGPLKVLGTFGQMLAPRLQAAEGREPESDMAAGMLLQGQRLADVVQQLEAALRPSAAAAAAAAARGPGWQQQQQQLALPPAGRGATAFSSMDDDGDELLWGSSGGSSVGSDVWKTATEQPQQAPGSQLTTAVGMMQGQLPASSAAVARSSGLLPENSSSSQSSIVSSNSSSSSMADAAVAAQDVVHLPGQGTATSLGASSRDIRWGSMQPATVSKALSPSASSSSSTSSQCSAFYSPATADFDIDKTIELVEEDADPAAASMDAAPAMPAVGSVVPPSWLNSMGSSNQNNSSSSSNSSRSYKAAGGFVKQQSHRQQQVGVCNVIDVFSNLLAAATKFAAVQGIHFIVSDPLQLDTSSSSSSSSSSSVPPATSAASAASDGSSTNSSTYTLLPRPVRPLLVGMAAATCKRVMGYVLDVALQCTPRGGQLCVTARQSAGGVEVLLQHTGKVQPSRLHPTTPELSQARAAVVAAAPPGQQGSTVQVATALPQQQQQQPPQVVLAARSGAVVKPRSVSEHAAAANVRSSSRRSRSRSSMQELAAGSGGSRLVSLDFATQILQSVGGRLSVVYPMHFMNALNGQLEVGSSIEVWLPPPAAT